MKTDLGHHNQTEDVMKVLWNDLSSFAKCGYFDYADGKDKADNPFPRHVMEHVEWEFGWQIGQDEFQSDTLEYNNRFIVGG